MPTGCVLLDEVDEGCKSSAVYRGERLLGLTLERQPRDRLPPLDGEVRVRASVCDGPAKAYTFRTLRGVPPENALVYGDEIYVGFGFLITIRSHPLYPFFEDSAGDPRPVRGCTRRRLRGRIVGRELVQKFFRLRLDPRGERTVTIHPSMTADLPRVGGLPRLTPGLRVAVGGRACRSGSFYAFRIAQRR